MTEDEVFEFSERLVPARMRYCIACRGGGCTACNNTGQADRDRVARILQAELKIAKERKLRKWKIGARYKLVPIRSGETDDR